MSKIYKISSTFGYYIGSTINTLEARFNQHKTDYEKYIAGNYKDDVTGAYITSFKIIACPNATIELVETYKCNTKAELVEREKEIIQAQLSDKLVNKTFNDERYKYQDIEFEQPSKSHVSKPIPQPKNKTSNIKIFKHNHHDIRNSFTPQ